MTKRTLVAEQDNSWVEPIRIGGASTSTGPIWTIDGVNQPINTSPGLQTMGAMPTVTLSNTSTGSTYTMASEALANG